MLIISLQIILFLAALCLCQRITILDTIQGDSITNCHRGLIDGADYVGFKTIVSFEGASKDWGKHVILELRTNKSSDSHTVFLKKCDDKFNSDVCNCKKLGIDSFEIICRIRANVNLSQAELRGKLTNVNGNVKYSESRILPQIFDLRSIEIVANDVKVTKDKCNIPMIPTVQALRVCCKGSPYPCKVSIFTVGKHLATKEECVHVDKVEYPDSITIEYQICGNRYDMQCSPDFAQRPDDPPKIVSTELIVIIVIVTIIVFVIIALFSYVFRNKIRNTLCNEQGNRPVCGFFAYLKARQNE